jgi:hypothetical protein
MRLMRIARDLGEHGAGNSGRTLFTLLFPMHKNPGTVLKEPIVFIDTHQPGAGGGGQGAGVRSADLRALCASAVSASGNIVLRPHRYMRKGLL